MKLKGFVLSILIPIITPAELARQMNQPSVNTVIPQQVSILVEKVFPAEMMRFSQLMGQQAPGKSADCALALVTKARNLLPAKEIAFSEPGDVAESYRASMALLILLVRDGHDESIDKTILEVWDNYLVDDEFAFLQIRALSLVWDPKFLTQKLWNLFEHTSNQRTVWTISILVARVGAPSDIDRLRHRLESEKDAFTRSMLECSLGWARYWHSDRSNPGPACLSPIL